MHEESSCKIFGSAFSIMLNISKIFKPSSGQWKTYP